MIKRFFSIIMLLCVLFVGTAFSGQVNTFIYHRFDEQRYPSTNIAAEIFKQQLDYLKENSIEVISLTDIAAKLNSGQTLPVHAVALCADDSYRSFYDVAMPLLRQYDFPFTLFVNTDAVGTNGYLSWSEIRQLHAEGIEIGNHTASHAYLVEMEENERYSEWRKRIKQDILRAQDALELNLGFRPQLFAYTFGEYSDYVIEIIEELGFSAAYAQQSGIIHDQHSVFNLPRFPMGGPFATMEGFVSKSKMLPLVVQQQEPSSPVIAENPPTLTIKLKDNTVAVGRINCFVQGENRCWVEDYPQRGEGWYRIKAEQPLTGRRNKFTLTTQLADGRWAWFSHLWVNVKNPVKNRAE